MLLLVASVLASSVSPVDKVVSLLHDLHTEVQDEGAAEAATYDTFACFCKTETNNKVASIDTREGAIASMTAAHKDNTATVGATQADLKRLHSELDTLEKELREATTVREEEHARYEEEHTDVSNSLAGLTDALANVGGSQSLVEQKAAIDKGLALVGALKGVSALQIPEVPKSDYANHGGGVLDVLNDLKSEFTEKKAALEGEETAAQSAFDGISATKQAQKTSTEASIATAETLLSETETNLAENEEDLTEEKALLADDKTYLKDLTGQCEHKAREWDQRSTMRKDELAALSQALQIIEGTVKSNADATGAGGRHVSMLRTATTEQQVMPEEEEDNDYHDIVFVQEKQVRRHASSPRTRAITLLTKAAQQTQSAQLSLMAMRLAADPFAKVKTLIQKLIERLVSEAEAEATQKGWCDTQLGTANKERDFRHADSRELNADIAVFTARQKSLEERSAELASEIASLESALSTASDTRAAEKAENKQTLENAQEGLKALNSAVSVLEAFYKKGSKASVALVQASPVDADLAAAGGVHRGAYKGKQAEAGGIIGMLQTIQSDFDRTIKQTTASENEQHRAFVDFSTETKASVASKETGRKNTEAELAQTRGDLAAALETLERTQKMLDASLETLEKLRPACVDTGMSYEERVARRETEIAALKSAVCVLDEEDGEIPECASNFLQKRK